MAGNESLVDAIAEAVRAAKARDPKELNPSAISRKLGHSDEWLGRIMRKRRGKRITYEDVVMLEQILSVSQRGDSVQALLSVDKSLYIEY